MRIARLMNGNVQVVDEDDEPLITVYFHNEAEQIPWETRMQLVRQMIAAPEPVPPFRLWALVLPWALLGMAAGYAAAVLVGFLRAM